MKVAFRGFVVLCFLVSCNAVFSQEEKLDLGERLAKKMGGKYTLNVRVIDKKTGKGVPNIACWVSCRDQKGNPLYGSNKTTDNDGRFASRYLLNGDYKLIVSKIKMPKNYYFATDFLKFSVKNGDPGPMTIELEEACIIKGRIVDINGNPLKPILGKSSIYLKEYFMIDRTDDEGNFRIGVVPGAIPELWIGPGGSSYQYLAEINFAAEDFKAGKELNLGDVKIADEGVFGPLCFEATVVEISGKASQGITFYFEHENGKFRVTSDVRDRKLKLYGSPPGKYTLKIWERPGRYAKGMYLYEQFERTIEIKEGEVTPCTITLKPKK